MANSTGGSLECIDERNFTSPDARYTFRLGDAIGVNLTMGIYHREQQQLGFAVFLEKFRSTTGPGFSIPIFKSPALGEPSKFKYDFTSPDPWYGYLDSSQACNLTGLRFEWTLPNDFMPTGDSQYIMRSWKGTAMNSSGGVSYTGFGTDVKYSLPFQIYMVDQSTQSLSKQDIVGIGVAAGSLTIAIVCLLWWIRRKRQRKDQPSPMEEGFAKPEIDGQEIGNYDKMPQELDATVSIKELDSHSPLSQLYTLSSEANRNSSFEEFDTEILGAENYDAAQVGKPGELLCDVESSTQSHEDSRPDSSDSPQSQISRGKTLAADDT